MTLRTWRVLGNRGAVAVLGAGAFVAVSLVGVRVWAQTPPAESRPVVVRRLPHDAAAFTQGLLLYDGHLYESTGLRGRSTLRRVEVQSGVVLESLSLPDAEFGEGLARVGDRLIQLTWQSGIAHVYDVASFEEVDTFQYQGEGWGLCFDGTRLVMSNGGSRLTFRDPVTFEPISEIEVTLNGTAIRNLNELECVAGAVYANVWLTDRIVRIDPATGEVTSDIDASGLLSNEEAMSADVLNGIAFDADSGNFFVTGKLWPWVFEVRFSSDSDETVDAGVGEPPTEAAAGGSGATFAGGSGGTLQSSRDASAGGTPSDEPSSHAGSATVGSASSCAAASVTSAGRSGVFAIVFAVALLARRRQSRRSLEISEDVRTKN